MLGQNRLKKFSYFRRSDYRPDGKFLRIHAISPECVVRVDTDSVAHVNGHAIMYQKWSSKVYHL